MSNNIFDNLEEAAYNATNTTDGNLRASMAVSLKRIADVAELFAISLLKDNRDKDKDMRDWAHRHGFGDLWDKATGS